MVNSNVVSQNASISSTLARLWSDSVSNDPVLFTHMLNAQRNITDSLHLTNPKVKGTHLNVEKNMHINIDEYKIEEKTIKNKAQLKSPSGQGMWVGPLVCLQASPRTPI